MGNADLRDIAVLEEKSPDELSGQTVAIDAHNWLYKYMTSMVRWVDEDDYTTEDGEEVASLIGVLRGLPTLLRYDITPVFVFDGAPDELKADEIERRRENREEMEEQLEEAREGDADEEQIKRLKSRTQRLTEAIHESTRGMFDRLDVPYVEGGGAGEAEAAIMARSGQVDAVLSEDYDSLLFGAPTTIRQFSASDDAEVMSFQRTLDEHDFTHQQLVDVAILCGTDYNDGVHGVGPATALSGVKDHGSLEGVLEDKDATIDDCDEIRELFLDPAVENPEVTQEMTTVRPDYDAAFEYATDTWELPDGLVNKELDRLKDATPSSASLLDF